VKPPVGLLVVASCLLLFAGFTIGWFWTAALWLISLAIVAQMFSAAATGGKNDHGRFSQ
jgi:hypothetical protein